MKRYKYLMLAAALAAFTSCADDKYETFRTASTDDPNYAYLNDYADLKTYVDRAKYPNFKLCGGTSATAFNQQELVYALDVANFDELVTGNDFKMGSVVKADGTMDFSTIQTFIKNADEAGLTVFGHNLVWHAQQPVAWLNSLIADKEIDIDPNKKIETLVKATTYTDGKFPFYAMGCEPPVIDGAIHFVGTGAWSQFFCSTGNTLTAGEYALKFHIKASEDVSVPFTIQNGWGGDAQKVDGTLSLKEGWNDASATVADIKGGNYDIILKPGTTKATLDLQSVKVYKLETPLVEVETDAFETTYKDGKFPFYAMGCEPPVVDGSIHYVGTGAWSQFFCSTANKLDAGDYKVYFQIKASEACTIPVTVQNGWGGDAQKIDGSLALKEGWNEVSMKLDGVKGGTYDIILKPGTAKVTLDLKKVTGKKIEKLNKIPLTNKEKADTLTWAMDRWIKGMMEACDGKVKAWDLVNEPMSDAAPSELKTAKRDAGEEGAKNFYWQDYLGKDYARTAAALARKYGPEDIKLFINDYNLEAAYNNNAKCDGLIDMIKYWESDGVTKIDGIGTQMHVTYSMNPTTQAANEAAVINMFKKLAATGKLIRVSELDMGLADKDGNTIYTEDVTEDEHHAMANYYKFIVEQYLSIIPPAQQYGICVWAPTDSPKGSGWRAGEPIGLWTENYTRKHTYAGFADGLAGK